MKIRGTEVGSPLELDFLEDMERLRRRLSYRTGSKEAGEDLLHDIWLRLRGRRGGEIRDPQPYLSRMADNLAIDELRRRQRRLPAAEVEQILELPDDAPSVEQTLSARDELRIVLSALADLPERRRQIFVAARLHGERYASIAARHRITTRTVENEMRRTLDFLADRLSGFEI
ncbi:MAG: RNA polymerase sigma factor [Pseudomonadota bacterium]